MLDSDNRASAEKRSGEFADKRLAYFWDGDRLTGKAWQRVLDLRGIAWDVYLLYGADARWEKGLLPAPDFWMHRLGIVGERAPFLNVRELEQKIKEWLGNGRSAGPAR